MTSRATAIGAMCVIAGLLGVNSASAQTDSSGTAGTSDSGSASTGSASTASVSATTTTATVVPPSQTSSLPTHSTSISTTTDTTTAPVAPPPPEPPPEGDGRDVDFIWLEAFGGVANVNLVAFQNSNFSDAAGSGGSTVFNEVNATGPMIGGALGFRVYWLAIGARTTFASYSTFQIGTVGGEVALRFPIPVVEPYIRVGFGYAWQGDSNYMVTTGGVTTNPATTVYGWAFNAALGLDIFLANWFTIGAGVGLDVLNMTRQSDPRMSCMGVTDFCPSRSGDAVGYQLSGFGQIGFHI